MGSPFTDEEKRFLLAEMIKVSKVDIHALVEFVQTNRVEQRWYLMQVPTGRNLEQCFQAAESMFGAPIPTPSLAREFPSTQPLPPASSPLARAPPTALSSATHPSESHPIDSPLSALSTTAAGIVGAPHRSSTPQHVPIKPRPATTNGVPTISPSVPAEPPAKRRRGRPPRPKNIPYTRPGHGGTKTLPTLAPLPPSTGATSQQVTTPVAQTTESSSQRTVSPVYSVSAGSGAESIAASRGRKRGPPGSDETAQPKSLPEMSASTEDIPPISKLDTPGARHQWPLQLDEDRGNRLQTPTQQTAAPTPGTTQAQQGPSPLSTARATPVKT
ncbi:hypothetical protein jhhlp_001228 [Lomentospora prolificans]|uniref:Uncharacterized protein n=1 Tax=Lomentospora prolificans TaxID=41688 RepID=A0A2N3NHM5_9PEZI|nr:hypothetical protein jhhlp_001228 [Lomentospora prolificans]